MGDILDAIGKSVPEGAFLSDPKRLACMHNHATLLKEELFGERVGLEDFKNLKIGADSFGERLKGLGSSVAFLVKTRGNVEARMAEQDERIAGKGELLYLKDKLKRRK